MGSGRVSRRWKGAVVVREGEAAVARAVFLGHGIRGSFKGLL